MWYGEIDFLRFVRWEGSFNFNSCFFVNGLVYEFLGVVFLWFVVFVMFVMFFVFLVMIMFFVMRWFFIFNGIFVCFKDFGFRFGNMVFCGFFRRLFFVCSIERGIFSRGLCVSSVVVFICVDWNDVGFVMVFDSLFYFFVNSFLWWIRVGRIWVIWWVVFWIWWV